MKRLESAGLTLERTGVGTDRELHTIRLKSAYVASICYSSKEDRFGVKKAGVWSDVCLRLELTESQVEVISLYIQWVTAKFMTRMFDGQP